MDLGTVSLSGSGCRSPSETARFGGVISFDADRFELESIRQLAGHYRTLLEGIVARPACRIKELPLLTSEDRAAPR